MSLLVGGIRLPFTAPPEEALAAARGICGLSSDVGEAFVHRRSVDARHGTVHFVYTIQINGVPDESALAERRPGVRLLTENPIEPIRGTQRLAHRPVIVGLGPAGLFAAYLLARYGYRPLILERGEEMAARDRAVDDFWKTGTLSPQSNLQFGEGGAGTYSDGKLTTRIGDPLCDTVLKILVENGAPREILTLAKPHVGTDVLKKVVVSMRHAVCKAGGEVCFKTCLTGVSARNGRLTAVQTAKGEIPCDRVVLAVGHSARDTFFSLYENGVCMEPKAFSVGVRIEHEQRQIDRALYGKAAGYPLLPPAEYQLSHRTVERACYSFCMCPGGVVAAAASELETVVTNGMSYHARDGKNANAALAVSVNPADFADGTPLGGIAFQRQIERAAYQATGSYRAPCQRVGDFLEGRPSAKAGSVQPTYPIGVEFGAIDGCLPPFVTDLLKESLPLFGRKIQGFDVPDALLTAPETRTSSPVRLPRGADLSSVQLAGLIPCGEGAGYAGGIMSAAVDGLRAALQIMREFAPMEE